MKADNKKTKGTKMRTEHDAGFEYAGWLVSTGEVEAGTLVDIADAAAMKIIKGTKLTNPRPVTCVIK